MLNQIAHPNCCSGQVKLLFSTPNNQEKIITRSDADEILSMYAVCRSDPVSDPEYFLFSSCFLKLNDSVDIQYVVNGQICQ